MGVFNHNTSWERAIKARSDQAPKTRSELLAWLWEHCKDTDVNVFKEGPFYACRIGKQVFASHVRALHSTTFQWWKECVDKRYFPF